MYHVDAIWRAICIIIIAVAIVAVGVAATAATATDVADVAYVVVVVVVCANAIIIVVRAIDAVVMWMIRIGYAISIKSTKEISAKSSFFLNMLVCW